MRLLLVIWLVAVTGLGVLLWLLIVVQSGLQQARRVRWRPRNEQRVVGRAQSL